MCPQVHTCTAGGDPTGHTTGHGSSQVLGLYVLQTMTVQ